MMDSQEFHLIKLMAEIWAGNFGVPLLIGATGLF